MSEFPSRPRGFGRQIRRAIALSQGALWVEATVQALWPALVFGCLVGTAALLGLPDLLAPTAHRVALGLAAAGFLAALGWGIWNTALPRRRSAIRRLDAVVASRPLATLSDRLVGGDGPVAHALWLEHQRRAEAAASGLRAAPPDLRLSTRDRWALRLFAPALLIAALLASGDRASDRLRAAISPGESGAIDQTVAMAAPAVEAWAVPPAYTGAETVYLSRVVANGGEIALPARTEITIRATGMTAPPELAPEGLGVLEGPAEFVGLGGGLYELTARLAGSGRIAVGPQEAPFADWWIAMIPDRVPEIEMPEPPAVSATRALEVPFAARDDYGVVAAWAEIVLADEAEARMEVEPIEFALPLPISGDPREVVDRAVRDLTDHPWAGAEVLLTLHAEDGAGQRGRTEPFRMRLPERRFTDPLARALAEQRRELIVDYGEADRVLDVVQSVTRLPEPVFGEHAGAYIAVRLAMRRLAPGIVEERVAEVAPDVAEFLWRAALTLESGDMASALERLREAEERLRNALESGTEQEIREAIEELRQAMNEYLEEMVRQALQNPESLQQQMNPNAQELSRQDLEQMLNELQRQAESGLRDQARDMLSQLSRMLENLQQGQIQAGQGGEGQQALQQLQELIQRQQRLSDETFDQLRQQRRQGQQGQQGQQQGQGQQGQQGMGEQQGRQGQPGGQGDGGMRSGSHSENGRLAAEQEALRRAIEELRNQLGGGEGMDGASRALDQAGSAMGEARDDLEGGSTGDALQDQMDALDALNEGAQALAEAVQNGQGQTAARGSRDGEDRGRDQEAIDPFDRPAGSYGAIDGSSTKLPNQALIDRARELLEELRRRSGERTRPELELEYFERLLEQF